MAAKLSVNMKTGRIPSFMNTGKDAKVFIKTQEGYTSVYMNTGRMYQYKCIYEYRRIYNYKCTYEHRKDIQVYI